MAADKFAIIIQIIAFLEDCFRQMQVGAIWLFFHDSCKFYNNASIKKNAL